MNTEKTGLILRYADAADLPALRGVDARAVDELAAEHYSIDQRRVWASFASSDRFVSFVRDVDTLVAGREGRIEGFCGIGANGHVASLYVIGAAAGRGLGTRLLGQACAITRHQPRGITDSRERCLHAFPRRTCDAEPDARRGRRDLTRSACREQWKRRARGANGRVSPARGRSALPSVRAADAKRRTQDGAARRSTARARQNPPRGHRTVVALRGIDKHAVGRELPPHGHIDSGH